MKNIINTIIGIVSILFVIGVCVISSVLEISWKIWCLQHWYVILGIVVVCFVIMVICKTCEEMLKSRK
ncbi:MAG: hypothetical protein HDQ88_02310 [Clostridia bacterium]|nr:hypothetical protein [Clostridia bacterium]